MKSIIISMIMVLLLFVGIHLVYASRFSTEHGAMDSEPKNDTNHWKSHGHGSSLAIKLHGWLMVFGWVGCITSAILVASCSRGVWCMKLFGLHVWFQLHRALSVIGLGCIVASTIIIFVDRGGWSKTSVHSVMGITSVILATLQGVAGFFRPDHNSPYRTRFNWAHWFFGNLALVLGLSNILLSALKRSKEFLWLLLSCLILYVFFMDLLKKLNQTRVGGGSGSEAAKTLQHYVSMLAVLLIISMTIAMLFYVF